VDINIQLVEFADTGAEVTIAGSGLGTEDESEGEDAGDAELEESRAGKAVATEDDVAATSWEEGAAEAGLATDEEEIAEAIEDEGDAGAGEAGTALKPSVVVDVGTPLLSTSTDTERVLETSTTTTTSDVTTLCRRFNANRSCLILRGILSISPDKRWRLDG
jgi:hypothetical protein